MSCNASHFSNTDVCNKQAAEKCKVKMNVSLVCISKLLWPICQIKLNCTESVFPDYKCLVLKQQVFKKTGKCPTLIAHCKCFSAETLSSMFSLLALEVKAEVKALLFPVWDLIVWEASTSFPTRERFLGVINYCIYDKMFQWYIDVFLHLFLSCS